MFENLTQLITEQARLRPEAEAVSDPVEALTYRELDWRVRCVAQGLREEGLQPEDRVIFTLPNSVAFIVAHFGVLAAGGISVPCEPGISEANLQAVRSSCQPRMVLRSSDNVLENWIQEGKPGDIYSSVRAEDVAALMYTTGTTGKPKGVMLTHVNILAALQNIARFVGYTETDREVVVLPLSHNFGLGHVYCNLLGGGAVYTEPGLTRVGRVLNKIESWGATGFPGTPLGFAMLAERYGDVFRQKAGKLRFVVVNSAPLPPSQTELLQALLPSTEILVYYGLTEASRSTFISLTQHKCEDYASVGPAMDNVRIEISDTNEIMISGPTVTQGYWGDAERTAQAIQNGRMHTGDLGYLDERGYLFVTGRIQDTINVGGYKVNPDEVERVLLAHPDVSDACVAGVDTVQAYIVLESGADIDETALTKHCRGMLEAYKVPTAIHCVTTIPRSETGKPRRKELLEREEDPSC